LEAHQIHLGAVKASQGAMETHHGTVEAHLEIMEAHHGTLDNHHGGNYHRFFVSDTTITKFEIKSIAPAFDIDQMVSS
jgi:hypothetical protein